MNELNNINIINNDDNQENSHNNLNPEINNNIHHSNNNLIYYNNGNNNMINLLNQQNNSSITITFLIILFINLMIEIYTLFSPINSRKYVFQFAPIYEKGQYYRFISNYFIHFGLWHKICELYVVLRLCYLLENNMGTLITISFIMISMVMNGALNFICLKILIHILKLACSFIDMNYEYGCGLTSVLFTMITFYYSLKNNKNQKIDILLIFTISGKFVSITALISLYCFTPNKSFCQNLSGIINGYIIKFLSFIFLLGLSSFIKVTE